MFRQDARYGRDTGTVTKGKTTFLLDNCPSGSVVKLCFSSDFFIEEADAWRDAVWNQIRNRPDCIFVTTTKRPERIKDCVPIDWGDGWKNVHISTSVENQEMADRRIPHLLDAPLVHREVFCSPLIAPITLNKYLDTGLLRCVNVGAEMAPYSDVRATDFKWILDLYFEARDHNVEFYFHQSGNYLIRDGRNIGVWNMKAQIQLAENLQKELGQIYDICGYLSAHC